MAKSWKTSDFILLICMVMPLQVHAEAGGFSNPEVIALNTKIQKQLQDMNKQQQDQLQLLDKQHTMQMQKMNTDLQKEMQEMNFNIQAQLKAINAKLPM